MSFVTSTGLDLTNPKIPAPMIKTATIAIIQFGWHFFLVVGLRVSPTEFIAIFVPALTSVWVVPATVASTLPWSSTACSSLFSPTVKPAIFLICFGSKSLDLACRNSCAVSSRPTIALKEFGVFFFFHFVFPRDLTTVITAIKTYKVNVLF